MCVCMCVCRFTGAFLPTLDLSLCFSSSFTVTVFTYRSIRCKWNAKYTFVSVVFIYSICENGTTYLKCYSFESPKVAWPMTVLQSTDALKPYSLSLFITWHWVVCILFVCFFYNFYSLPFLLLNVYIYICFCLCIRRVWFKLFVWVPVSTKQHFHSLMYSYHLNSEHGHQIFEPHGVSAFGEYVFFNYSIASSRSILSAFLFVMLRARCLASKSVVVNGFRRMCTCNS